MKRRILLAVVAAPLLTGCFSSMEVKTPKVLYSTIADAKDKYYTSEKYTVSFSCDVSDTGWQIRYAVDDDGGTGFTIDQDNIHINDKITVHASNPGTAKFHFYFNDEVSSSPITMTFVDNVIDVSTSNEFLNAINTTSSGVIINVKEDLDFTGVEYTPVANFAGKIYGNNHTISNIDRLTTKKDDCLSLIKNFTGYLDGLNFKDCKFNLVAESSRIALFAATSSGTVKNVNLDNIEMDSNLVNTMGSLIGYVEGGEYENITATNLKIKGKKIVGGIFGDCTVVKNTSLTDITASGNVELYYNTEDYVGGISSAVCNANKYSDARITVTNVMTSNIYVGQAYNNTGGVIGFARNCDINFTKTMSNENTRVLGVYSVGGLYGLASNCVITNAVNYAEVYTGFNAKNRATTGVGGIAGQATNCDITKCKNYGLIVSMSETAEPQGVGGVVGWANGDNANRGNYYYLENYGSIEGKNADGVAGIVGRLSANCNRTFGFLKVDVDYIRANNCCGSIVGYVEINGTFSLNSSTYKYNECTYNRGHCSDKEQGSFEPAIGGFSYYKYGSATILVNDVQDLNN